jgi:peptidoglycan hydrolase CwlO-like protein
MVNRKTRKKLKKIQKKIDKLKKEINKIELRPCHTDSELDEKDEEVRILKLGIYELERDANVISLRF